MRTLLITTFLVAWVISLNSVRHPFGFMTAIPFALATPLVLLNGRTVRGGTGGALAFGILGEMLIGWDYDRIEHWLAVFAFAAYGFSVGCAVHSIFLKNYLLGAVVFFASLLALVYILMLGAAGGL